MIFDFLKKQTKKEEKIKLIKIMFLNMHIPEAQKSLYIQALDVLDEAWVERVYQTLSRFIEEIEIKDYQDLHKENYTVVQGMRKKEAEERKQEINNFSYLLTNIQ